MAAMSMSRLPRDIQVEILLKLPAKSILTCKCVCKLWLNRISSPKFINDHLKISIQNKNNHKIMLMDKESDTGKRLIYSIDYASITSTPYLSCEYLGEKASLMDTPFEYKKGMDVRILGTCNGLICLGILIDTKTSICIWNPTTREFKEIQNCDFHISPSKISRDGFGYDNKTGDYKMLRIADEKESGYCEFEVYTFGLQLSKTVLTFHHEFPIDVSLRGVFLNGCLHWISNYPYNLGTSKYIVSFDISNEKLMDASLPEKSIVHPEPEDNNTKEYMKVGVLGDCLSLVLVDEEYVRAEVWVMQDYGVRQSWAKLFTTTHESITMYAFLCTPMILLRTGEIMMYTCDGFVLCDPKNERVGKVFRLLMKLIQMLRDISRTAVQLTDALSKIVMMIMLH
ncbi:F-box/kelch-repeat protein At3g23880-like [Papaver somniferum]|uniref:F-box/kelch-repeat protein At3g23880-like n=1 Tax=Papaver somniferum TaxID=3469 RepID=UPI000E6FDFD6|nr:F-box/kelch-repeat protein At3g23880-like [Papaver somniferum]